MKNKGFSLLELLIVIAIIGLITSVAVPKYLKSTNKARWETSRLELKRVAEAFDQYNLDHGFYPEFASWDEIASNDNILIRENYIDKIPTNDKFGRKYEGSAKADTYLFSGKAAPGEKFSLDYPMYYIMEGNFLSEEEYQAAIAAQDQGQEENATEEGDTPEEGTEDAPVE